MYGEMMQYYGLVKDFDKTDYFETEAFKGILSSLEIGYLFHPDVGQFSIMLNGEPVADPLVRFAAVPTFLVIILFTGVLMVLLFFGVGVFIFMAALFIAFLGLAIGVPFFWPILLIIFLIIALTSMSHNH